MYTRTHASKSKENKQGVAVRGRIQIVIYAARVLYGIALYWEYNRGYTLRYLL